MNGPIVIVGSINMDLVSRAKKLPRAGETVLGDRFFTSPGGKGANQAVACARLVRGKRDVLMIGNVGDDEFGATLLQGLRDSGVDTRHVKRVRSCSSGVAAITVDDRGENSIVVTPGANARVTPGQLRDATKLLKQASVVLFQLEIPLRTVAAGIGMCRRWGVRTILDPAPAPAKPLSRDLLRADIVTPNETEARSIDRSSVACLVLTRGARGATWIERGRTGVSVPTPRVRVVDTTAAGDAFTGALAVGLVEGMSGKDLLRFACAAGSLACTRAGAQPSLPLRQAVDQMLG